MVNQRSAPIFVGESPGLDFLNSIATPVDTQVEWIGSGEDLIAWLVQAGMVPAEVIAELRKRAVPGEFDNVAAQARKLREWFREGQAAAAEDPSRAGAVEPGPCER